MPTPTPAPIPSAGAPVKVLVVDDHPIYRQGLRFTLADDPAFSVSGEAESAAEALELLQSLQPDVALVDVSLNGSDGIDLAATMLARQPRLKIIVISMHDESFFAIRALRAGARGYVMKSEPADQIAEALRQVAKGKVHLSPRMRERLIFKVIQSKEMGLGSPVDALSDRELEVLEQLGRGLGTQQIATELHLSGKTVETHRANIKDKLRLPDSAAVARFAADWRVDRGLQGKAL